MGIFGILFFPLPLTRGPWYAGVGWYAEGGVVVVVVILAGFFLEPHHGVWTYLEIRAVPPD